jgi:hypothetical protein
MSVQVLPEIARLIVDCGIYLHSQCETYVPALCGVSTEQALKICSQFEKKSTEPSAKTISTSGMGWPVFHEDQFEYLSVIGKGNFGKACLEMRLTM